ncbi:transferrin receptor protein 1 [Bombina bombina]|uniref:transferrin receptor protein 1 n=1 Tax=Bombina bombina TaxID=8345 RepID=UPI00235AC97C|nr:transferrin receptor protein 1 [Bombina bombina]
MERARTSVTNFFGRVPLSYTRFSLTQQMDGDASQVEMKLAADEEECGEQTVGGHVVKHRKGNNYKSLCFRILAITLLILIGFLVGYLCRRGREVPSQPEIKTNGETASESLTNAQEDSETEPEKPSILYWGDLQPMLSQQIGNLFFEDSIRRFSGDSHEAGSFNDENNALFIHEEFSKMSLDKVWDDEHYVTLQSAGSSPNKVTIVKSDGTEEVINPPAYVAYSPSNYVTGSLVYCQYGRNEDFKNLQKENIDVAGRIVLVRSGIISISEKVANAERSKAIGVLIYPDPLDFSFPSEQETILSAFGHAHFGTGDPYTPGFPSFNNTQFPPSKSSGLPQIPVQTISSETGKKLLERDVKTIKLEVTNVMHQKKLLNIFGVIKGFDEPDRYVVVGAQRDAWGPGAVKSAVGTSILLELARALSRMVASGNCHSLKLKSSVFCLSKL